MTQYSPASLSALARLDSAASQSAARSLPAFQVALALCALVGRLCDFGTLIGLLGRAHEPIEERAEPEGLRPGENHRENDDVGP